MNNECADKIYETSGIEKIAYEWSYNEALFGMGLCQELI